MNIMRPAITITLFALLPLLCLAQLTITSLSPNSGEIGSSVSIYGNGFSDISDENTVFFGGMEALILNATENELTVSVPHGAYNNPIYVYTNGLYTASSQRFNVTFEAEEELTTEHLSYQLLNPYLGQKYYDVKIADMNGDGIPELVTSESGSSNAYLAIFKISFDDEGFISIDDRLEINFGTGVYSQPQDIAIGDLNGDGLLDVVVSEKGDATDGFQSHTCIFINASQNQSFAFESPITIDGEGYEAYVQLQDINGDGKLDIVTSRQIWNQLGIYLNTSESGNVSFADKIVIDHAIGIRPAFADLNGDGMIDMVATRYYGNNREVFVYTNISTEETIDFNLEATIVAGGFPPGGGYNDWNWSSSNPSLVDLDGDGKRDIVVTNGNCGLGCSPSGISVIRNVSTDSELLFEYSYSDWYAYESNTWPLRFNVSDLNGDGKPDLLTNDSHGGISILVNSSTEEDISLEEQMFLAPGNVTGTITTSDLNIDGTPEIVVLNRELEGLRIIHNFILNTAPVVPPISCDSLELTDLVIDFSNSTINIAIYNGYDYFLNYPHIAFTIDANGDTIQQGNPNLFVAWDLDTTWYNYSINSAINPSYPLTVYFVTSPESIFSGDTCVFTYSSTPTGIQEFNVRNNRKIISIVNALGQETPYRKNTPLFYIYDDGTVEKKIILE